MIYIKFKENLKFRKEVTAALDFEAILVIILTCFFHFSSLFWSAFIRLKVPTYI